MMRIRGPVNYPPPDKKEPVVDGRKMNGRRKAELYSPREDNIIRAMYPECGPEIIGERLGRSAKSIATRARQLNVKYVMRAHA